MDRLFVWTLVAGLGAGGVLAAVTLALSMFDSPSATLLGCAVALVLSWVVVALLRHSPLWPRGAHAAMAPAAIIAGASLGLLAANVASSPWFTFTELAGWRAAGAGFAGAYPKAIGKALAVVVVLMASRKLDRPWHGFVVGALAGLGFELFENIQYGAAMSPLDVQSDLAGAAESWPLRWRLTQVAGWFLLAFTLHFAWNYDAPGPYWRVKWAVMLAASYLAFAWVRARGWKRARADADEVVHLETRERVRAN